MKYTFEMTMFEDDGEEAFSSSLSFDTIDALESFFEEMRPNFTPLTEVHIGAFGELDEDLPSDEDCARVQRLLAACPDPSKN